MSKFNSPNPRIVDCFPFCQARLQKSCSQHFLLPPPRKNDLSTRRSSFQVSLLPCSAAFRLEYPLKPSLATVSRSLRAGPSQHFTAILILIDNPISPVFEKGLIIGKPVNTCWPSQPTAPFLRSFRVEDRQGPYHANPQDWFPYSGTLIGLLRHGARSGMLSNGKVDVVDHDVDIMVGTTSEAEWCLGFCSMWIWLRFVRGIGPTDLWGVLT